MTTRPGLPKNTVQNDLVRPDWAITNFRRDLAFPRLTEEMVQRLRSYGREKTFPGRFTLFTYGSTAADMFIVLRGGIDVFKPAPAGGERITGKHRRYEFAGEFNLLNSQGAVVEARTTCKTTLLCIAKDDLPRLMRAEGDIANLIVQAAIWRRINLLNDGASGVVLTGSSNDPAVTELRRFLIRNSYPHRFEEATESNTTHDILPNVRLSDGRLISRPAISALADELGITELPRTNTVYDVAVVGAGPGGTAAALYAASEGLRTIIIEGLAPGGQAGTSSKIENYLGFPMGISGQELASRAQLQALKFGTHFAISRQVVSVKSTNGMHTLALDGGTKVCSRSVVVATGAQYRRLAVEGFERYENCGLFYAATPMEAILCQGQDVLVVGGGNSAGQASIFLSGYARHVFHVVRGESLESSMSQYLISRIESSSKITLCTGCDVVALEGDATLQRVAWTHRKTGERINRAIRHVFVMIGAEPNSGWLFGTVLLDTKGFVLTGGNEGFERTPYCTNVPGIYAIGDVRAHSVKRVASAVGEGSVVISDVHRYLNGAFTTI